MSLASLEAPRSEVPSLPRHYPASLVLRTSPTPTSVAVPRAALRSATPRRAWASHVARRTLRPCCSPYPGGLHRLRVSVASATDASLPRLSGGSASTAPLSRPAQDLLALQPARLLTS